MVVQDSLMTFFLVDKNLAGIQVEMKHSNSRDGLGFLPNLFAE